MVLTLKRLLAMIAVALFISAALPARAHPEHNQTNTAESAQAHAGGPRVNTPGAMHEMMEEHGEAMEAQQPKSFGERLMRFLGQMHPLAVHFPIALFPVSWLALIIARRRGHAVDLIRAFIIVAGAASVGAGVLGWLSGGFALADTDPVLTAHRWTGTALAVLGAFLGLWAWRKAASVNSRAMVWLLGAATLVLLAQGFMGAVLVHGWEHMRF